MCHPVHYHLTTSYEDLSVLTSDQKLCVMVEITLWSAVTIMRDREVYDRDPQFEFLSFKGVRGILPAQHLPPFCHLHKSADRQSVPTDKNKSGWEVSVGRGWHSFPWQFSVRRPRVRNPRNTTYTQPWVSLTLLCV